MNELRNGECRGDMQGMQKGQCTRVHRPILRTVAAVAHCTEAGQGSWAQGPCPLQQPGQCVRSRLGQSHPVQKQGQYTP